MPYVGARSPEAIEITIASNGVCDASLVTGLDMTTKSPKQIPLAWTWTIVAGATSTSLVIRHLFSDNGLDARDEGRYIVSGWLLAGTTRLCRIKPVSIPIDKYG